MESWEYIKRFCLSEINNLSSYKKRRLDSAIEEVDKIIKEGQSVFFKH